MAAPGWDWTVYGSEGHEADPIQGMDADVWIEDPNQASLPGGVGKKIMLGSFSSIVVTIRFATEPYLTFNQRIHRLLDGDIQIAFVLERGFIDTSIPAQTFGFIELSRGRRINRSPRYEVTLNIDSNGELPVQFNEWYLSRDPGSGDVGRRMTDGRMVLKRCKMDSLHIALNSGKSVGVNQWQGLAEGLKLMAPPGTANGTRANDLIQSEYADSRAYSNYRDSDGQLLVNVGG